MLKIDDEMKRDQKFWYKLRKIKKKKMCKFLLNKIESIIK